MSYRLQDLIDLEQFQMLQDRLSDIYSFPSAIIDNEGNILTATAWQEVCTSYHRRHPECEKECVKSDQYILDHLGEAAPTVIYRCPHGLVDTATPIVIDGNHLANFFTGQFFLETPDLEFFRGQARRFGFDEEAYLESVRKVPVWTEEQLRSYLFYIRGLIELISSSGLRTMREMEATRRMEESEKQFKAIFETAAVGIAQTDPETGRFLLVNRKMCEITGYSAEEMSQLRVVDITHLDDRNRDWALFKSVVSGAAPAYRLEKRYVRKDGSLIWVNVNMTIIRDGDGRPLRTLATIEDITKRKRVEQELRNSEERYRMLFSRAGDGILLLGLDGTMIEVNEAMARMHGYTPKEMKGMKLQDLDPVAEWGESSERIRRILAGEVLTFEVEHYHRKGHLFPLEVSAGLVDQGGTPYFLCFHRDITKRRAHEEEKQQLEEKLRQATKLEAVGRLAGGVAHDFNNMLGVILGHAELALLSANSDQSIVADLKEIRSAAQRSSELTNQLLAFARRQAIVPRVLDLNQAIEPMLKMLRRLIGEDINLEWQPGPEVWPVRMDPSQIDQVLANLCVNSRDAIEGPGTVCIRTENCRLSESDCAGVPEAVPGDYVVLAVADDGHGMSPQVLDKLFEPFFTTKESGRGTGLGLATVYGIVSQNRGFIKVESSPGKGTVFNIYLPRSLGAAESVTEPLKAEIPRGAEVILLVEDEAGILRMTRKMLERLGYRVLAAATPGEAVRLAQQHPAGIDLLVTDVIMPELNGRELGRILLELQPGLKSLFTSGYTADVIAVHGVLEEGVNFLQKPFQLRDLAVKVRQVLDEAS